MKGAALLNANVTRRNRRISLADLEAKADREGANF
jgi:hypothetical protein